ncbi:hypothetical protein [Paraburkholderia tropica]|uniref:hypothetical protein n=1 Tax=Paraburkholderia tropica TaxID=92647 RepID=UPI0017B29F4E|nr:hypothetical protein [Paraburkholderia tropica]MBB2983395.1 hypothetical protein [Paraburkholderia tropica]
MLRVTLVDDFALKPLRAPHDEDFHDLIALSRQPTSESVQRFLRDALRVIRAATDISGDVNQALFWYRNEPLPVFDYKTAEQLVSDGRTDDLLRYVSSLEAGGAG